MSFKDKVLKVVFVSSSKQRSAEECLQFTSKQQTYDVEFDHFSR